MTGETDSRHHLRRDDPRGQRASGGQGGQDGQTAGSVFVSGAFGTLTYGDTNGADEQWVGDVPGDYSLTGLNELDETRFISNGGDFGNDSGASFADNPFARPTVRYDFDIMGFGISASSNRDLTDIVVGTGYAADFGGGSWSVGVGYNNFEGFTEFGEAGYRRGRRSAPFRCLRATVCPVDATIDGLGPGGSHGYCDSGRRAVVGRPERRLRGLRLRRSPT